MKKLLVLGANFLQKTAIIRAKELGYYVISADNRPDNPGHAFADETYNVSTIDKDGILELAKRLKIDGILSYASDVSAPTAAYVSENMGLPTNPYNSVMILTHKELFRAFMTEHSFTSPGSQFFKDEDKAYEAFMKMELPVIIKPNDSSGSKGVVKITDRDSFHEAFNYSIGYSISKTVIIERFVQRVGYQIDGDGFIADGKIEFFGVMDQHNNHARNPYAPIGLSYPSIQDEKYRIDAKNLIQSIFDKLDMKFGAFNFEYIIGEDGKIYILEIGPRNGGNFIPDTIEYATGIDMISASICACLGDEYKHYLKKKHEKTASSYVVHSLLEGNFEEIKYHEGIEEKIIKSDIPLEKGEKVHAFVNGGDSIGAMVVAFDSIQEMNSTIDHMWDFVEVVVK